MTIQRRRIVSSIYKAILFISQKSLAIVVWWYRPNGVTRFLDRAFQYLALTIPIATLALTHWTRALPPSIRMASLFASALIGSFLLIRIYSVILQKIFEGFYAKVLLAALGFMVYHVASGWSEAFIISRMQSSAALFPGTQDLITSILTATITMALLLILIIGISLHAYSQVSANYQAQFVDMAAWLLTKMQGELISAREATRWTADVFYFPFRIDHYRVISACAGAFCIFLIISDSSWSRGHLHDLNLESFLEWSVVHSAFDTNTIESPKMDPPFTQRLAQAGYSTTNQPGGPFSAVANGVGMAGMAPRKLRCSNLAPDDLVSFVNPSDLAPAEVVIAVPLSIRTETATDSDTLHQWGYRLYDFYRVACTNTAAVHDPGALRLMR